LAGKILCATIRDEAKSFFLGEHQVGVAVPGGAEAMTLAASITMRRHRELDDTDFVMFKIDYINAFNIADRATARDETRETLPALLRYFDWVYSTPAVLLFGDHFLESSSGFHQGDPPAPALFSLVLAKAVRTAMATDEEFGKLLRMFFLDDGVLGGPSKLVARMIAALDAAGRPRGLQMNPRKCEVIGAPSARALLEELFQGVAQFTPWDSWSLLGVPCGNAESQQAAMDTVVRNAIRRTGLVRQVGLEHPHLGYALLRQCCGFCLVNYHMRAIGPSPSLPALDATTMDAFCAFTAELDAPKRSLAELPLRMGGLGLRPATPFAAVAQLASARSAASYWPRLCGEPPPLLHELSPVLPDVSSSPLLSSALSDYLGAPAVPGDHAQRLLSSQLELDRANVIMTSVTGIAKARVQSASSPCGSAWLIPRAFEGWVDGWFSPACFTLAICHRFGLPLTAEPMVCRMCGSREADVHGEHTLRCLAGGERTALHNDVRDHLFRLASHALLRPQREHMCFGSTAKRCDIFLVLGGKSTAIDVAVTHFATAAGLRHAAAEPGGAATHYEVAVKQRKYGAEATEAGVAFAPVVFDTMGAIGQAGLDVVKAIARRWGHRLDIGPSRSIPVVLQRLSGLVMRGICRILLHNTVDDDAIGMRRDVRLSPGLLDAAAFALFPLSAASVGPPPIACLSLPCSLDTAAALGGASS
jgi:hypothetical protein